MELSIHTWFFFMVIIFPLIQLRKSVEASGYDDCKKPFLCGNVSLGYPFYDGDKRPEYCGYPGFEVKCDGDDYPDISLTTTTPSAKYYLLRMDPDAHTISVVREDLQSNYCPEDFYNTTLNYTLYNYSPTAVNVTLYYDCSSTAPFQNPFKLSCPNPGGFVVPSTNDNYNYNVPSFACTDNIFVPVKQSSVVDIRDPMSLQRAFQEGFELEWYANNTFCDDCRVSKGVCGYNTSQSTFTCYRGTSSFSFNR